MKKKLLIILLIPLLVLVTACTKKETKEKEETKKEEVVTFTDEELQKFVDYIIPSGYTGPSAKLYNTDLVEAEKLSLTEKFDYIAGYLYKKQKSSEDYEYSILSEEDVKKTIEEVYGPDIYEKTSFSLGCGQYELRDDGNYYARTGCGGVTTTSATNIVIDYKATKTKLEITTAYAILDGAARKIYKDYDKTIELDNYELADNHTREEAENYMKDYILNNKDKLSHIVYTFESKDGKNYYFKQFKNNK